MVLGPVTVPAPNAEVHSPGGIHTDRDRLYTFGGFGGPATAVLVGRCVIESEL